MNDKQIIRTAINLAAQYHSVNPEDLLKPVKRGDTREVSRARHLAYWILRKGTSYSLPFIGKNIASYKHDNVIYGIKSVNGLRDVSATYRTSTQGLLNRFLAIIKPGVVQDPIKVLSLYKEGIYDENEVLGMLKEVIL